MKKHKLCYNCSSAYGISFVTYCKSVSTAQIHIPLLQIPKEKINNTGLVPWTQQPPNFELYRVKIPAEAFSHPVEKSCDNLGVKCIGFKADVSGEFVSTYR